MGIDAVILVVEENGTTILAAFFYFSNMTIKQAEEKLIELREKRKALNGEINDLRYLIAELTNSPLRKDFRERDKKIYLDWKRNLVKGKKGWRLKLWEKYDLGPDRVREIYNQQKELRENKKGLKGNLQPRLK